MRWMKSLFSFLLMFSLVFSFGSKPTFALSIDDIDDAPPTPKPGSYAPPKPYKPGGYDKTEILVTCESEICWPPPDGNLNQPIAGYYESNGVLYPIDFSTKGTGGGDFIIPTGATIVWVTTTPTPTPTPVAVLGPWVKLKDASFQAIDRIQSYIPAVPVAYDADDTAEPYFIIGDSGVVTSESIAFKGLNANAKSGVSDWQYSPYSVVSRMNSSLYTSYLFGRKTYKLITSLSDIDADGLYLYNTLGTLDIETIPSSLNQYNVVLVSTAVVNIKNTDDYFKPTKSTAILAPIINFAPNVREAKGIFISMTADTGTTVDRSGLKYSRGLSRTAHRGLRSGGNSFPAKSAPPRQRSPRWRYNQEKKITDPYLGIFPTRGIMSILRPDHE